MRLSKRFLVVLTAISVLAQGCYLIKQGKGQLELRYNQIPMAEAILKETNPDYRRLLAAVSQIKEFAEKRISLEETRNYSGYYATSQRGITFVVTACEKNRLSPYSWWFPIIGSVPYKGFFQERDALALEKELQSEGYDTWLFVAPAYSTLGWFEDPITTPMLRRGHYYLAETIIHEMTHVTVYVKGDGTFNEQLASFVGQKGAFQYLREKDILNENQLEKIKRKRQRNQKLTRIVGKYIPGLKKLYGKPYPLEEIVREREIIFSKLTDEILTTFPHLTREDWKFNNARLLQYLRYKSESKVFQEAWDKSEKNWEKFWELIRKVAKERNPSSDS
ncbi:MAG: aminopeptidase [Proteobacteria bacterium]|nr:aminopeptidase [Pseudomonadota bacterium]